MAVFHYTDLTLITSDFRRYDKMEGLPDFKTDNQFLWKYSVCARYTNEYQASDLKIHTRTQQCECDGRSI